MAKSHPMRNDLTAEYVRSVLDYDPETGVFRWKGRGDKPKTWNNRFAGKVTGSKFRSTPRVTYLRIVIDGVHYLAHRLAWLHYYGGWPETNIDHRDNDGLNNRIGNLRLATLSQNNANSRRPLNSSTGYKGACWCKREKRFKSSLHTNGKHYHLGYFDTAEEAHAAYMKAARDHFGEFARSE